MLTRASGGPGGMSHDACEYCGFDEQCLGGHCACEAVEAFWQGVCASRAEIIGRWVELARLEGDLDWALREERSATDLRRWARG